MGLRRGWFAFSLLLAFMTCGLAVSQDARVSGVVISGKAVGGAGTLVAGGTYTTEPGWTGKSVTLLCFDKKHRIIWQKTTPADAGQWATGLEGLPPETYKAWAVLAVEKGGAKRQYASAVQEGIEVKGNNPWPNYKGVVGTVWQAGPAGGEGKISGTLFYVLDIQATLVQEPPGVQLVAWPSTGGLVSLALGLPAGGAQTFVALEITDVPEGTYVVHGTVGSKKEQRHASTRRTFPPSP